MRGTQCEALDPATRAAIVRHGIESRQDESIRQAVIDREADICADAMNLEQKTKSNKLRNLVNPSSTPIILFFTIVLTVAAEHVHRGSSGGHAPLGGCPRITIERERFHFESIFSRI